MREGPSTLIRRGEASLRLQLEELREHLATVTAERDRLHRERDAVLKRDTELLEERRLLRAERDRLRATIAVVVVNLRAEGRPTQAFVHAFDMGEAEILNTLEPDWKQRAAAAEAQVQALTAENGELQDAREHGWQDRALTSEAERDQLKAQVQALQQACIERMAEAHGIAQEQVIRDVNAGLLDDLIAPRLRRAVAGDPAQEPKP